MPRAVIASAAAFVLTTLAALSSGAAVVSAPSPARLPNARDTLEVRVGCDDHIALTLRDPRGRTANCSLDSSHSAIPGCRAFTMVEIYNAMGEDGVEEAADSADVETSDTTRAQTNENASLDAADADTSSAGTGTLRFVVPAPQSGEWLLDARVPAGSGYLAATLWLDVRIVPNRSASHIPFGMWAELRPGGRVWTRLRVGLNHFP